MELVLNINDEDIRVTIRPGDTLLKVLRGLGYFGVKHGCESGDCGACAVLLDGKPVNTCVTLAAQAAGHRLKTIESIGQHPAQGWKTSRGLHPIQQAFVESGAIQCGYCIPTQILAALELIQRNPDPSEAEVRDALSGVLCRCTGYLKPITNADVAADAAIVESKLSLNNPTHAAVTLGTANGLSLTGQQLTIGLASAGVTGALFGSDWSNFNGKQAALTFPLGADLGGTGIANAAGSTLTLGAATSITGGGTIALGTYTLTVPATGTVALLATANVFTTQQMVDGTSNQIQLRVQGHSTQTANIQTWENSSGGVVGYVSGGGWANWNLED